MKKAKLTLTLNKETVTNLNQTDMNNVKGGDTISARTRPCQPGAVCEVKNTEQAFCRITNLSQCC